MEETTVLVVGAGPSGLSISALLARMNIKVVILEKETEVCEDPRGIVINGDAVRISYQMGIGEGLTKRIGKDIGVLNFHRGNFRQPPYMSFDITIDWAEQCVSNNLTQFQPNYEREIRNHLKQFPNCELRTGCEVTARQETEDCTVIEYKTEDGTKKYIRTSWLVGADGKRGVVRKKFLEPEGIRQEDGFYTYVGTWVAANLHITDPTPKSHPKFPLWELGYTPEQVHDIFWPSGFHFCNDSKRPAVSGRFGPPNSGFWRHEFSVEPHDTLDDIQEDFWKQFGPFTSIPGSKLSKKLRHTIIEFPRDCIKIVRCRPFTFAAKVVNRWYCRKTTLIGDAAHVFPPFGGQGIVTGIRDAQSLGWRLALMSNLKVSPAVQERIMAGWSQERHQAWVGAAQATKLNGSIVNQRSFLGGLLYRLFMRLLWCFPSIARFRTRRAFRDKLIYDCRKCPDGFFLNNEGGGQKVAQIWVRKQGKSPLLSDAVFLRNLPRLGLLVIVRKSEDGDPQVVEDTVRAASLPEGILTIEDITFFCLTSGVKNMVAKAEVREKTYFPCSAEELLEEGISPIRGYNSTAVQNRLSKSAKYVLIRPDFFVHSVAADTAGLLSNLQKVKEYFS